MNTFVYTLIFVLLPKSLGLDLVKPLSKSPCPDVFEWKLDESGAFYGVIRINGVNASDLNLHVELLVQNNTIVEETNLDLLLAEEETTKMLLENNTVLYNISCSSGMAHIANIIFNDDVVCQGVTAKNQDDVKNLTHHFEVNSAVPRVIQLQTFDISPNKKYNGHYKQFHFNPPPTDLTKISPGRNKINFRPQTPRKNNNNNNQFSKNTYFPFYIDNGGAIFNARHHSDSNLDSTSDDDAFPIVFDQEVATKAAVDPGHPYSDICGKPITTNSLIVEGNIVPNGAYPWLVAIFRVRNTGLNYICSGSLISNRHIVTAAHCVQKDNKLLDAQEFLIILGKMNIAKWVPTPGEMFIEPSKIYVHSNYAPTSSDADIAVIELSQKVKFSSSVLPICLWQNSNDLGLVVGNTGVVAGWGKNEKGLTSAEPRQTSLPIVEQDTCLRSSHQFQFITSNRTFCAGLRDGSGPCNGDSGSGFVMKRNNVWMLRGIVSMSISDSYSRTCDLKHYVVFTDASKFTSWLLSFIL